MESSITKNILIDNILVISIALQKFNVCSNVHGKFNYFINSSVRAKYISVWQRHTIKK